MAPQPGPSRKRVRSTCSLNMEPQPGPSRKRVGPTCSLNMEPQPGPSRKRVRPTCSLNMEPQPGSSSKNVRTTCSLNMEPQPGPSRKNVLPTVPDFQEILYKCCDNLSDEGSDQSDAESIVSDHDSASEQEVEDVENFEDDIKEEIHENYFYGKNGFEWHKTPLVSARSQTLQQNNVGQLPGLRPPLRKSKLSEKESWSYLFCEDILNAIMKHTNEKLQKAREKYKDPTRSDLRDLDLIELRAFLGLLYYTAVFKSNTEDVRSLFATDGTSRDIFRCVMNSNRFTVLLNYLRFDDFETRQDRKKTDPTAAISYIFEKFVSNSQACYTIGALACIDEMLVSFRGRSKFKIYIPSKPRKYGIKIMIMTDARNSYFLNGYIYCGKQSDGYTLSEEEQKLPKPTQAVLRLSSVIQGTNRNITADNWFSSVSLATILKRKKLTYVGTLKKNEPEIPREFLPNKKRVVGSSIYAFSKDSTLVSFVPKKNRTIILISSMHFLPCDGLEINKPEIINFYNNSKAGVDSLDEKCATYCTGRRARRWSMAIFYRLLDICSVNAFIIHQSSAYSEKLSRLTFMKNLAKQLVTEELMRRLLNTRLPQNIRPLIKKILGKEEETLPLDHEDTLQKRKYCAVCPKRFKRKTSTLCCMCRSPICGQCSAAICGYCVYNK